MSPVTGQCVGIDISEDFLDVYLHPAGKEVRLPHNDEATASLLELLRGFDIERIVLESTGGLQRRLVRSLQEAGYAVSVVNPERIWAYRRLVGRVAKTDRIDARLIAEYGATMRPAASVPLSEAQQGMRELTSRRDQLIEAIAAEKKRLRRVSHEVVRASLESQIASLEREVKRIGSAIEEAVPKDEATRATAEILQSIPGVGKLTAHLMAIDLPELGRLRDKQIASLAGVAPHPDESGKYRGRACIRGGRPRVRAKLYMAAFNARKYNPVIGAFYARLVSRGKMFKQAMTACMRKLLVLMNTLVARGQLWDPCHAT
jgi:transposase